MTSIEELWVRIGKEATIAGAFRRFDDGGSLDLYAGVDPNGRHVLMLLLDDVPAELPTSGIVEVTLNQRADGKYALLLRLDRPEFHELFAQLCQDLIDTARASNTREEAAITFLLRLNRWRRLLAPGLVPGLSESAQRGLFGELWFLQTIAIPQFDPVSAVQGWNGPFNAPHDFSLLGALVELKTVLVGNHRVTISSADQLDGQGAALQLAVLIIDAAQGESLPELIGRIRDLMSGTDGASEFELRLAEAGYTTRPEYAKNRFHVVKALYYPVEANFPRITAVDLAPGITDVGYTIDLHHCGTPRNHYIHAA